MARRPQMAHPVVNAGFRCRLDAEGRAVPGEVTIVLGGLASCNGRMPRTEQALAGRRWDSATLRDALAVLDEEVASATIPMEGEGFTVAYRRQLALGFFYKFYVHVAKEVCPQEIDPANLSAADDDERPLSQGRQVFQVDERLGAVTRPIVKRAAFAQASGEIRYPSDEPLPSHGAHGVLVLSRRAHARFRFAPPLAELEAAATGTLPRVHGAGDCRRRSRPPLDRSGGRRPGLLRGRGDLRLGADRAGGCRDAGRGRAGGGLRRCPVRGVPGSARDPHASRRDRRQHSADRPATRVSRPIPSTTGTS